MAASRKRNCLSPIAAFAVAVLGFGCKLDPVQEQDLCKRTDGKPISMSCPQCSEKPYAENCSDCRFMEYPDPETCEPRQTSSSPSSDGAGAGGDAAGSGGVPSGAGGQSGGAGTPYGAAAGSGGMSEPQAGTYAQPPPMNGCVDHAWCSAQGDGSKHGCRPDTKTCVECVVDEHCQGNGMQVCNTELYRCQNCVDDSDCGGRACDGNVCVDCTNDGNCTDPTKNQCDTSAHQCVDCVNSALGCPDSILGTCDVTSHTCVDCLDDVDCREPGKRACDKPTRTCIPCLTHQHCEEEDPLLNQCSTERTCVDCINDTGCIGQQNTHCDQEAQVCVECLSDAHCESGLCLERECVECKVDADCTDPAASRCDPSTRTCVGCATNANCEHLDSTPACDMAARRCVECVDDTTCDGTACIRSERECSDVPVFSLDVCEECAADSMCKTNMRCVPLQFDQITYGNHCVFTRASRPGGSCSNARPYTQNVSARSIDGMSSTYCAPHDTTSCPGVLDVAAGTSGSICSDNLDCGIGEGDGQCSGRKCTYACESNENNCPVGLGCTAGGLCGGG